MECSDKIKYDVGFVLDVSGSLGPDDWITETSFTKKRARRIDISPTGGRAAVTIFDSSAWLKIKFSDHLSYGDFEKAVERLPYKGGGTSISTALDVALNQMFQEPNGMRNDSHKELILITDGHSDASNYDILANDFQTQNIKVIVLGVGGDIDKDNLRRLVTDDKNLYIATNFEDLKVKSFADNVGEAICQGIFMHTCLLYTSPSPRD